MSADQGQYHYRILAALALVYAHRIGRRQRIQFAAVIRHIAFRVTDQHHLVIHVGHPADIAVKHTFVVVVARLHHLVADPEDPTGMRGFQLAARRRVQRRLQQLVQVFHAAGQAVHRRQHLHVPSDIDPFAWQFIAADPHYQLSGGGIVSHLPQLKIARAAHIGKLTAIDPVGVHYDLALAGLAKNLSQPHHRRCFRTDDIFQHRPRPHRRQLVDIADQYHPAAVRHCPQQIIHQQDIHHRHFVDDHHIGVNRIFFAPSEHRPTGPRPGSLE